MQSLIAGGRQFHLPSLNSTTSSSTSPFPSANHLFFLGRLSCRVGHIQSADILLESIPSKTSPTHSGLRLTARSKACSRASRSHFFVILSGLLRTTQRESLLSVRSVRSNALNASPPRRSQLRSECPTPRTIVQALMHRLMLLVINSIPILPALSP